MNHHTFDGMPQTPEALEGLTEDKASYVSISENAIVHSCSSGTYKSFVEGTGDLSLNIEWKKRLNTAALSAELVA